MDCGPADEVVGRAAGPTADGPGRRRFAGGWPDRAKVRFVCLAVLAFSLALLVVSFATFDGSRTAFGPALGADFSGFYAAGTLLREYPPERLYDFDLQDRIYHRVLPEAPAEEKLPYVYPPFFTLVFRAL